MKVIEFLGFRAYCGYIGWGWKMIGIGYKTKWFFGYSVNLSKPNNPINATD